MGLHSCMNSLDVYTQFILTHSPPLLVDGTTNHLHACHTLGINMDHCLLAVFPLSSPLSSPPPHHRSIKRRVWLGHTSEAGPRQVGHGAVGILLVFFCTLLPPPRWSVLPTCAGWDCLSEQLILHGSGKKENPYLVWQPPV